MSRSTKTIAHKTAKQPSRRIDPLLSREQFAALTPKSKEMMAAHLVKLSITEIVRILQELPPFAVRAVLTEAQSQERAAATGGAA